MLTEQRRSAAAAAGEDASAGQDDDGRASTDPRAAHSEFPVSVVRKMNW
jgi:hypothetical protein